VTFVKALLFPLAVCIALLVSEYEVWCLEDCWTDISTGAFSPPAARSSDESAFAVDARMCLLCWVVAPGDDEDADDE
jgi:hypothetical protein